MPLGGEDKQYNRGYYAATTGKGPGANKKGTYETRGYGQTDPLNERARRVYESQGYSMAPDAGGYTTLGYDPNHGAYRTIDSVMQSMYGSPQPAPTAPTSAGGGGGYRGGGGGSAQRAKDFAAYQAAMLKLINNNPLSAKIAPAIAQDIAAARAAYAALPGQIPNDNPYLKLMSMQAPQVDPGMEQFLRSQGVGTAPYASAVENQNAQLAANSQNWQGLAQTLGANQDAARQRLLQLASLQGENIVQSLQGQQAQLQAAADQQRQQQLMALMQAALQYGAPMPKVA